MKLIVNVITIIVVLIKFGDSTITINHEKYCPEGYSLLPAVNNICVLVTSKSKQYVQECLKSGSLSTEPYLQMIIHKDPNLLEAIFNYLADKNITTVWLPIKRNNNSLLVWDLAGPLERNGFINEITSLNNPINYDFDNFGDCVVLNTQIKYIRMDKCTESYQHLCLISATESLVVHSALCNNGFMARLSKFHDLCFKIEDTSKSSGRDALIIDSYDKFAVIAQLIEKLNMTNNPILVDNKLELVPESSISVFQNGTSEINVAENGITKRLILEHHSTIKQSSLSILYNTSSNHLLVTVANYEYLWSVNKSVAFWCISEIEVTDNQYLNLNFDLINESQTTKVFRTNLPSTYQGIETVWCVGQMLITLEKIESNRILIERNIRDQGWDVVCGELNLYKCQQSIQLPPCKPLIPGTGCKKVPCEILKQLEEMKSIQITNLQFMLYNVHIKKILTHQKDRSRTFLLHFLVKFPHEAKYKLPLIGFTGTRFYEYTINFRLSDVCESTNIYFPSAQLNQNVLPIQLCYYNSKIATQECIGNIMDGAHWRKVLDTSILNCTSANETLNAKQLFNVIKRFENFTNHPSQDLVEIIDEAMLLLNKTISSSNDTIEMQLSSETLYRLGKISQTNIFDLKPKNENRLIVSPDIITNMSDGILNVQIDSLIDDEITMLNTIDLLTKQFTESSSFHFSSLASNGVRIFQSRNVIFIFINPLIKNITGFEIHRKTDQVHDFLDFTVKTLDVNHRIEDTKMETLELMGHIPAKTFNEIRIQRNDEIVPVDRIIYKIYYQTFLFNQTISKTKRIIADSKLIGIKIPNYPTNQLYPDGAIVMIRPISSTTGDNEMRGCSENTIESSPTKKWSKHFKGTKKDTNIIVACRVKRSANTGFAKLLGPTDSRNNSELIEVILNYTTNLGCILSVIGLTIIFVTAIFNREWQKREATPLLVNISIAAMFLIFIYYIENFYGTLDYKKYCSTVGGLLHLAILVGFCISVLVTNCQYRRYLIVLGPSIPLHFKMKILIFGWILPFVIVVLCWGFSPESYTTLELIQEEGNDLKIQLKCFPKEGILYFCLHLPIIVIFVYNLGIYLWIIKRLIQEDPTLRKSPRKSNVFVQIRLFLFLFFVLSITWIFGILHYYTEFSVFAFIFNLTTPLQGFCLCIFSVIIDLKTRQFWIRTCAYKTQI